MVIKYEDHLKSRQQNENQYYVQHQRTQQKFLHLLEPHTRSFQFLA
jgi:hypothetical protein